MPTSATAAGYYTLRIFRVPDDYNNDTFLLTSVAPVTTAPIVLKRIIEVDLDVSADGQITPVDALLVINRLNSQAGGEGESTLEASSVDDFLAASGDVHDMFFWPALLNP